MFDLAMVFVPLAKRSAACQCRLLCLERLVYAMVDTTNAPRPDDGSISE
jgi:hypothetical protein